MSSEFAKEQFIVGIQYMKNVIHHHQPNRPQRFALNALPLSVTLTALLVLLAIFALIALCVGRFQVDPLQAVRIIASPFINEPVTWTSNEYSVIMNVRVPRVISAILVLSLIHI